MESCLIVVLLCPAAAAESRKAMAFLLSMVLLGIGFNVKMGAALALAPALIGVYMFAGGGKEFSRRLVSSAVGGIVLLIVSLSWVVLYGLTPANNRPH